MTTIISIVLAIIVFNVVAVIVLKRRKPAGETAGTVAEKPAGNSAGTVAKPDGNTSGTGTAAGACVVELPGKTNDVLYQQVCFSDDVGGRYVSAYYCSDVAGGEYTLQTDGDLLVKLKLLCGKGELKRENFTLIMRQLPDRAAHKLDPLIPLKCRGRIACGILVHKIHFTFFPVFILSSQGNRWLTPCA
jgi:hypothetical protein